MRRSLLCSIVVGWLTLSATLPARAIPAFSRQYSLSCATCHVAYPKLNAFGEQFLEKGYIFEGMQEKAYVPNTGDEVLNLFEKVPLGLRFQQWMELRAEGKQWKQDFKAPWAVKLLTGGALGSVANFYAYVIFEKGEAPFFEDAWVDLHPWEGWGIQVGQFQICDLMFPRELRLSRSDYQIYTLGRFPLTYQRGLVLSTPVNLSLGVVNGNGIGEYSAGDADTDTRKVFFGHLDLPLGLGLFGLYGESLDTAGALLRGYRLGVDGRWMVHENVQLFLQVLVGYDNSRTDDLYGGFLGIDYTDFPHVAGLLVNWVQAPPGSFYASFRQRSLALFYGYYPYRNLRLLAELERQFLHPLTRLTLGIDFAF